MNQIPIEKQNKISREEFVRPLPRLLDPVSAVESIVTAALESSTRKMGLSCAESFIACLKQRETAAFNYYCYNIARELGKMLGSWSNSIKAVYTCSYDEAASGEDDFDCVSNPLLIHMIVWAEQKSKALNALLEALDRAMVQRHQLLLSHDQLRHMLDAQVVDDEDVRDRTGYAALLNSIYQPPIQVWGEKHLKPAVI